MKNHPSDAVSTHDCEINKQLNIFHGHSPISFNYVDTYTDMASHHPLHIHRNAELYFCVSEHVDYVVEHSYYRLLPGDIVIIQPNEVHKVVLREAHQYKRFFIAVPVDFFPEQHINPLVSLMQPLRTPTRLRPPPGIANKIDTLLYKVLDICRENTIATQSPLLQTRIYAQMLELLCAVCESIAYPCPPEDHVDNIDFNKTLANVMLYIDQNFKTIQSVNEIAEVVHISPSYLSTLFRKHLGVPLVYHLQSLKMGLAKQMLEEGYSVTDTCREIGFSDCSYFIRIFKRHLGMTPLKYRSTFFTPNQSDDMNGQ